MITKQTLTQIRGQIDPFLETLNKGNKEFRLRLGNCTYSSDTATFKLEVQSIDGGEVVTKELSSLRLSYSLYGLSEEHLTKEFQTGRGKSRLVGLKPRANKCFIFEVIEGLNRGKRYVTDTLTIKRYLEVK